MTTVTRLRLLRAGMLVECPYRSTVGNHDVTIMSIDPVGASPARVTLSCGHVIPMTDSHGLFRVTR